MSTISEYLSLIPKAFKNADKVLEGVVNKVKMEYGGLDEDKQREIIRRRLICADCPFMSSNAVVNKALEYKTDRFDEHCIHCGCNIELKTASLESRCGIEAYNHEHPGSELALKWDIYLK